MKKIILCVLLGASIASAQDRKMSSANAAVSRAGAQANAELVEQLLPPLALPAHEAIEPNPENGIKIPPRTKSNQPSMEPPPGIILPPKSGSAKKQSLEQDSGEPLPTLNGRPLPPGAKLGPPLGNRSSAQSRNSSGERMETLERWVQFPWRDPRGRRSPTHPVRIRVEVPANMSRFDKELAIGNKYQEYKDQDAHVEDFVQIPRSAAR